MVALEQGSVTFELVMNSDGERPGLSCWFPDCEVKKMNEE